MLEWIKTTLENPTIGAPVLLAAFLLGVGGAIASTCCTLPVLGAIVGFAAKDEKRTSRAAWLGAGFFMLGSAVAIIILGMVAGFIGQAAQNVLGGYWKLFAGGMAVVFGLATLGLLPFKLALKAPTYVPERRGMMGSAMIGLGIGGLLTVCSVGCNPGIFGVMAVVVLQGYNLWAVTVLAVYAVGFSLPLALIMVGVSLGKMAVRAKRVEAVIRFIVGVMLIGVGFYFLATL